MPPAARVTDMHTCPMVTGVVPHVGGPILPPGAPTVLIDFLPAATVTNMCTCVGPPDTIIKGSAGVMINYLPAARLGDNTAHGGVIILGSPTCIIGEVGAPSPGAGGMGGISAGLAASGAGASSAGNPSKLSTANQQSDSASTPRQVMPSAVPKLQKIGVSSEGANQIVDSPESVKLVDHGNDGNINHVQQIEGKLVRITTDPDRQRIISAGIMRADQITNGLSKGRFSKRG